MQEQDYKRMSTAREWARQQVRRDIEWHIYEALRDSANAPLPLPSEAFLDGFYGRDWPNEI